MNLGRNGKGRDYGNYSPFDEDANDTRANGRVMLQLSDGRIAFSLVPAFIVIIKLTLAPQFFENGSQSYCQAPPARQ